MDSSGRRVKTTRLEGSFGTNRISWNLSDLKSGMYHMQVVHPGGSLLGKFLKL
jgi:hypothetical protein